jgi:hypothetical protein
LSGVELVGFCLRSIPRLQLEEFDSMDMITNKGTVNTAA